LALKINKNPNGFFCQNVQKDPKKGSKIFPIIIKFKNKLDKISPDAFFVWLVCFGGKTVGPFWYYLG